MQIKSAIVCIVVTLTLVGSTGKAFSDELYIFHRTMCAKELHYFNIKRMEIPNQGEYIWATRSNYSWDEHKKNLIKLENKYGLYVLDEMYGHYSDNNIICEISRPGYYETKVIIEYDKLYRPKEPVGGKKPYRANPRIIIKYDNKEVMKLNLNMDPLFVEEVSVNDMEGLVLLNICATSEALAFNDKNIIKCRQFEINDLVKNNKVLGNKIIKDIVK